MTRKALNLGLLLALLVGAQAIALAHDAQHDLSCQTKCLVCSVSPALEGAIDAASRTMPIDPCVFALPSAIDEAPSLVVNPLQPPVRAPPVAL